MGLLALPTEILDIIIDLLNAPNDTFQYDSKLPVSTACLCKLDKIYAKAPEAYPIWPEWKRDSLALSSVCKAMRSMIFDRFWLKKAAMDWKREELSKAQTALSVASCEKVQILILNGDCNDSTPRPLLQDLAALFPNLREIRLVGVYPSVPDYEKTGKPKKTTAKTKNAQPVKATVPPTSSKSVDASFDASLPPISISIHRSLQSNITKHETHTTKFIQQFQTSAQIGRTNSIQLDAYHLEFAMSRSKEDRGYQSFWGDFTKRMKEACKVPASAVTICLDVLIDREIRQFLNALSSGIQAWPKDVERISFVTQTDDFAWPGFKNKLQPKRGEELAELATGYLPTQKDMDNLLAKIRKSRPGLQQFSLIIYVRNPDFGGRMTQKLFEFCHNFEAATKQSKKETSGRSNASTSETKVTATPAKLNVFRVVQSTVDKLHEFCIKNLEDFGSDFDFDEFGEEAEMEMQFREENEDEEDY